MSNEFVKHIMGDLSIPSHISYYVDFLKSRRLLEEKDQRRASYHTEIDLYIHTDNQLPALFKIVDQDCFNQWNTVVDHTF